MARVAAASSVSRLRAASARRARAWASMAPETAYRSLAQLGLSAGHTILIRGAGSTIGFAAVQIALIRGAE